MAEFGTPTDPDVHRYLRKKLPHFCFHVVNLASHKWVVWAPIGYPYCPERQSASLMPSVPDTFVPSDATPLEHVDQSASFVDDLIDLSETTAVNAANNREVVTETTALDFSILDTMSWPNITSDLTAQIQMNLADMPPMPDAECQEGTKSEQEDGKLVDYSSMPSLQFPVGDNLIETNSGLGNQASEEPFDFLKNHPDLIAELSKSTQSGSAEGNQLPDEDLRILAEVLTLQRLQDLVVGGQTSDTAGGVAGGSHVTGLADADESSSGAVPVPPPETTDQTLDYLEMGFNPDQVMTELQSLKERSGGVLHPEQMEPFLDYFGEMSSRELDRIEALEGKARPKKGGAGARMKRNMAIRFPSQSQATPSESRGEYSAYDVNVPRDKLPVADFDLSESSDESEVMPVDSSEYIKRVLSGEDPSGNGKKL